MNLGDLICYLKKQDPKRKVKNGFGSPHSDRRYYVDLAFDPVEQTTFGEMLDYAMSAVGSMFTGWKGGEFQMHEYTECHIGKDGRCGERITKAHLRLWELDIPMEWLEE